MSRSKKLPKVWISWRYGYPQASPSKTKESHPYAPVQKPKVCVWRDDGSEEYPWHPSCTYEAVNEAGHYCPYCGGKIKVKR